MAYERGVREPGVGSTAEVLLIQGSPLLYGEPVDAPRLAALRRHEIPRLEGRFAVARREPGGAIVMARDRSGFVPLYYDPDSGRVATSAHELNLGRRGRIDMRGLATYVTTSNLPAPLTIWQGVRRCPAGAVLELDGGSVRTGRLEEQHPRDRREAARQLLLLGERRPELHALAEGATLRDLEERELERWAACLVVERLRDALAGRRGLLLSGGIDSTILGFLMNGQGGRLRTFTFGAEPQDPWSDGPRRASPVAARLGSDHRQLLVGAGDYARSLDDYLGSLSEPALSSYLPYLVSRHLSGDGGWVFGMGADETFFGDPWYGKYVRALRVARLVAPIPRRLRAAAAALLRPLEPRIGGLRKKLDLLVQERPDFRFLYAFSRDNLDVEERLALLAPEARPAGFTRDDANFSRGDPAAEGLEAMQEMLLVHEFPDGHGQDLAHFHGKLDLHLPFFAPAVVAAAIAVRPSTRARPGKQFLRDAARGVVPPDMLRASKGSFVMPAVTWLHGPLAALLRERLAPERLRRRGFWNVPEVTARLARFTEGRGSPFDIIRVLHLELWMDRHGVAA